MCGILGIFGHSDVSRDLMIGLVALQHRGQDSAGIVTFDKNFRMKKGMGLVQSVFREKPMPRLSAPVGLGHVRYATMGSTDVFNAQPFAVNYPFGLAMVHNGNVINFIQLRKTLFEDHHRLLDTSNDLALILYTFASELERRNLQKISVNDIFGTVRDVQEKVIGAFSTITIIANLGFLAFTDPYGIRPIVMGRKYTDRGVDYAFASESTAFDYMGYEMMRDLEPGEAVFIDHKRKVHSRICKQKKRAFCVFEYIYFAREDSIINKRQVAADRVVMGRKLAARIREAGVEPDIVIDVPSSAYFAASGLAEELGVPYRRGLAKNNFIGRSFISASHFQREQMVRQKLNPLRGVVRGKKVAVVDDSIVRGTTSKHIVKLLRDSGAAAVYFISASPPIRNPCIYGIDMSTLEEIIAAHYDTEQIARYIEADEVIYQSLADLRIMYKDLNICDACFSGEYPTGISKETLDQIEQEKKCSKRT